VDLKTLKKLVAYCRQAGITTYKSGDVEFILSPTDPKEEKKILKKHLKVEKTVEQKLAEMSDEDILLYSSQGYTEQDV
jgi:hypothetical protein